MCNKSCAQQAFCVSIFGDGDAVLFCNHCNLLYLLCILLCKSLQSRLETGDTTSSTVGSLKSLMLFSTTRGITQHPNVSKCCLCHCITLSYKVVPHSWLSWLISTITLVYGGYIYSYWDYKPTDLTGGAPPCNIAYHWSYTYLQINHHPFDQDV